MKSTTTTPEDSMSTATTTADMRRETADLLTRVENHLEKYIAFANPVHSRVLSLWVLHTHAFDAAYVTPYLYVSSVDPGAGKTTLMDTLADVARNPANSASTTESGMFRKIDAEKPTLFIDEVDTIYSGSKNDGLRGVLNSGYLYNGKTNRTVGDESVDFSTFCPKCLGGIDNGMLPETVLDRCIRIRLRKLTGDALAERNVSRRNIKKLAMDTTLNDLNNDLARWASIKLVDALSDIEPPLIEGLSARQWDVAEPLIQIATMAKTHKQAREDIVTIFKGEKVETEETRLLTVAREAFAEMDDDEDRIPTSNLATLVGYTPERLSRTLSPLGIKARPMKVAGKVVRGYYRSEFESAWERYL